LFYGDLLATPFPADAFFIVWLAAGEVRAGGDPDVGELIVRVDSGLDVGADACVGGVEEKEEEGRRTETNADPFESARDIESISQANFLRVGIIRQRSVEMRGLLAGSVLLVTYVFEPIHNFSVELFLDGDMGDGGCESGPVPVFFARGKPDHIAGTDLLDWRALALSPAAAGSDDQRLAERVGMPCGSRARLEGDTCTLNKGGIRRLEEWIDPYCAGEPI
jgi:hypothetical protein